MAAGNPNPARITEAMWWLWLRLQELEPGTELGGIYANKSGYHNTRSANASGNYSVREAEDQQGPSDKSAALDWTFPSAQRGDYRRISLYCQRLMASGKANSDPRLNNLREWYGQTDNDTHVEGWDCRHLYEITSDSSHLWHVHFSFDRGKVNDFGTMRALLSVLRGETVEQWVAAEGGTKPNPPAPEPKPNAGNHAPGTRVLRLTDPHMTGDDVRFVQRWIGPARAGAADGDFGPSTRSGVQWYQRLRGLAADGEVGPKTFAQMGVKWVGG